VGARLGAHFARGCSVVLGCARSCSILTRAYGASRGSGLWWWQSLQARGHRFETCCAHPQVRALLVSSGEAWRRVSTSCQESAPGSGLTAFAEVSDGFGPICVAWVQVTGSASETWSLVRHSHLAVGWRSSAWSTGSPEGRRWERKWERWWERNLGEHSLMGY
jgi:hypothetical protein